MAYSATSSWQPPSNSGWNTGPTVRQPSTSMYSAPATPDTNTGAGMYSAPAAGLGGAYASAFSAPTGFNGQSGGSLSVGDISQQYGNDLPGYQADQQLRAAQAGSLASMYGADQSLAGSQFGNLTQLAGTGLQTEAQKAVANTNVQPALQKLDQNQNLYFPYLQTLIAQNGGGGSNSSQLFSNVLAASNPAHEQAALNSAAANAARGAESAQQTGLRQVAGSGWAPSSPVGAALTAASQAGRVGAEEEAKRQIRDQFSQQRVTNLAQAINSQTQQMNPIYSLLSQLMS